MSDRILTAMLSQPGSASATPPQPPAPAPTAASEASAPQYINQPASSSVLETTPVYVTTPRLLLVLRSLALLRLHLSDRVVRSLLGLGLGLGLRLELWPLRLSLLPLLREQLLLPQRILSRLLSSVFSLPTRQSAAQR